MHPNTHRLDLRLARLVKTDSLVPCQQATQRNFKTACQFSQQIMLKHPYTSDFHSLAEHLHAGLLEGDCNVISYVPQPYQLRLRGQRYKPDCYVAMQNGPRRVLELKPRGEFIDDKRIPLEHFFAEHGMTFEVVSNESVFDREIEARNWLEILKILHIATTYDTQAAEEMLLELFYQQNEHTVGDIVDSGDRERTYLSEIALFRLLHRGHLKAALSEKWLNYDTEVTLCR